MLRHALRTSTFLSLSWVLGNIVPSHMIILPSIASVLFLIFGAKGEGPSSSIRFANSPLVFGHSFSL